MACTKLDSKFEIKGIKINFKNDSKNITAINISELKTFGYPSICQNNLTKTMYTDDYKTYYNVHQRLELFDNRENQKHDSNNFCIENLWLPGVRFTF